MQQLIAYNMHQATFKLVLLSFLQLANLEQVFPNIIEENIKEPESSKSNSIIGEEMKMKVDHLLRSKFDANQNPEENGAYFEGDIMQPPATLRNGMVDQNLRWKNGVVPVELRGDFNSHELNLLNKAFEIYHNRTCIQFLQHSIEDDYIVISKKSTGCWSNLGRIGGQQFLNLQSPMCFLKVGTALHELMHVLGFNHEHTREDRDEYVEIFWKNVPNDAYKNFGKASPNTTDTFGIEYDYNSVLHYSPHAFSVSPSKPTIGAVKRIRPGTMGQRDGLSTLDVEKIRRMYNCTVTTTISLF